MLALAAGLLFWTLSRSLATELSLPFSGPGGEVSAERAYGELPLAFERDAGRSGAAVDFLAHTPAGTTFVGPHGATLALGEGRTTDALRLELANGAAAVEPKALEQLPGEVNYLVGERSAWKTGIATFERVRYPDVYPGVSLDWYGNQRQLEYDFRLAPGADPARIALEIGGAERLRLAPSGDLVIDAGQATVRQRAPVAYQTIAGEQRPVEASFALRDHTVGFRLGAYDRSRPLVIDPLVVAYSTYLGGNDSDVASAIAVDSAGAAYVTGQTDSTDFNTVGQIEDDSTGLDAFVSKLNPAGSALAYSTYLGGSGIDFAFDIAVDSSRAAYVTGATDSTDYCTGAGCSIEPDSGDGAFFDAFVSKLNPAGSALAYSTYLGGNANDFANGIAVDSAGAAYVTGETDSTDFDTVGEIEGDSTARDAFVSKLNPAGSALAYSTYLGGNLDDLGFGIAIDNAGAAYVTGRTASTDFDTIGEVEGDSADNNVDAFVSKLVLDTDSDGVIDSADNCQLVANTNQTNTDSDAQGDACDPDDDNDTVADSSDNCQLVGNTNQTNTDSDAQGDACDPDDDNDTVADGSDNCQLVANTNQTNTDSDAQGDAYSDAQGDACDPDDDNDGVADAADACPTTAARPADGCPAPPPPGAKADRTLTLDASKSKVTKGKKVRLSGQIDAATNEAACEASQTVELQRVKQGTNFKAFTTDQTNATGKFALKVKVKKTFRYRAEIDETTACEGEVSNTKKVKAKRKRK